MLWACSSTYAADAWLAATGWASAFLTRIVGQSAYPAIFRYNSQKNLPAFLDGGRSVVYTLCRQMVSRPLDVRDRGQHLFWRY